MDEKHYAQILELEDSFLKTEFEPLLDEAAASFDVSFSSQVKTNEADIRQQYRNTLSEILYQRENRKQTLLGFDILIDTLHRIGGGKNCKKELQKAGEILLSTLDSEEEVQKSIEEVRSLKNDHVFDQEHTQTDVEQALSKLKPFMYDLGITDDSFKIMYDAGVWLFSDEQYDKAASVFQFLTFLNSPCFEVWFSMALCYHKLENWPQTISSYSMAVVVDATCPLPYIGLIECYKKIGDDENASYTARCAKYVITHSNINPAEQKKLLQHIQDIEEEK
jgi:tetratricopeptide (TPR) repeat protein